MKRLSLPKAHPHAYPALIGLNRVVQESVLSEHHGHLIKLYASGLNRCTFCVELHAREALAAGLPAMKLLQLATFREAPVFDDRERALLALTAEVTDIPGGVSDEVYSVALKALGEQYLAAALLAIVMANTWNRVGVATSMVPE